MDLARFAKRFRHLQRLATKQNSAAKQTDRGEHDVEN
jgi:hypothetical protein